MAADHFFGGVAVLFAVAGLLILLGLWLRFGVLGYRFSSLICFALAGLSGLYGLLALFRHPVASAFQTALTVCVCIGLAVVAVTECLILRAALRQPETECSHIIVLGCLVRRDGPSAALRDRIHGAYRYLADHPDTVAIVSGGQGEDEPRTEAGCMFEELVSLGIDPDRILVEDRATSTWENLRFSLALLAPPPRALGILSSDYHLFRTSLLTKKLGLQAQFIPAKTTSIPHALDHFLREAAGVWHFILLGGRYDP